MDIVMKVGKYLVKKFGRVKVDVEQAESNTEVESNAFEEFESRKWAFDQIMEALHDDNSSKIGVWGMGGVGKTTLVKEVYKKAKELKLFSDVVMVVVSRTPNIRQIQNEIAGQLNLNLEEDNSARARRICVRIRSVEKILIILDDIWNGNEFFALTDLESIGISFCAEHKGLKLLLTARSEHMCNLMDCEKKVSLGIISEEESLSLIKKVAVIDNDSFGLNDVVRKVVKECQGLPIAIDNVGRALIENSLSDWKAALLQLRCSKLVDITGVHEGINAYVCLKRSYDHLNRDTKLCFLLCALFPEDYDIPIEELTRYGIGLGVYAYFKSIEDRRMLVRTSIDSLKSSSLLLDSFNEEYVKMHDVVRDVALWIASEGENEFSLRTCTHLEDIQNTEDVNVISLWANNTEQLLDKLVCPKLNILSLGKIPEFYELENPKLPKISDTMFEGMKGLKVLSLRNQFFSSQSLLFLTDLRCLVLVNCDFHDLSSLGKLKSLEILKFSQCRMVALINCHHIQPPCFPKLGILEVIDCGTPEYLFSISVARGFLLQLEELILEDLPELKQVFGDEREGEVVLDENKLELSKLRKLILKNSPKLSSICQGNISSMWPSLKNLLVMNCPKMRSSFVTSESNVKAVEKVFTN